MNGWQKPRPLLSDNPAVDALKRVGSSPVMLAAAVCGSLHVLCWIGFTAGFLNFFEQTAVMAQGPSFQAVPHPVERAAFGVSLSLPLIPAALNLLAMWMHYASCRSRRTGGVSTAGLTLWKAESCVILALLGILLVLVLVIIVGGIAALLFNGEESGMPLAALIPLWAMCFVFMLAGCSLPLLFHVFKIRLIGRAKAVANTGSPDNRTPLFLVVFNYAKMGFLALYGLGFLTFPLVMLAIPEEVSQGVPSVFFILFLCLAFLLQAAYLVLVNVSISRYKKEMTWLMFPAQRPLYPPAGPGAFPPQQ